MMDENTKLLTPREVAAILRCSVEALYVRRARGLTSPPAIKLGKKLLYDPVDVRAWIEENRERREK
ncbi:MAG: helix-turn-helix domain-containing protein [Nitrospirae bacterium]|nr:helix-turn-helix domain-containing protein [Nitrospirota bacterium]